MVSSKVAAKKNVNPFFSQFINIFQTILCIRKRVSLAPPLTPSNLFSKIVLCDVLQE